MFKIVETLKNNPFDTTISISTLTHLKTQIINLKNDNLLPSGQFSRMFEVNLEKDLIEIELLVDSLIQKQS